jgi:hypothetical protein
MKSRGWLAWLGLIALLAWLGGPRAWAQSPAISPEEFWRRLEATRTLVDEVATASPETSRRRLAEAADEWAAIREVVASDGTRLPVDPAPLIAALRADPPNLQRGRAQLTVLRDLRRVWPLARHTARDLESLRAILAQPEFQWATPEPSLLERWWEQLRDAINEWLRRLLSGWGGEAQVPALGEALTVLASVALLTVLFFVVRGLRGNFAAEAVAEAEAHGEPLTAAAALDRAQSLSASGDFRAAVRYLYLGALLVLDERGLLRYDRSATNREYLRRVANRPELARHLREVVEVFDRVWYGFQPLDESAYATYAQHVAELRRQA